MEASGEDEEVLGEIEVLESIYINELAVDKDDSGRPIRVELLLHPATGEDAEKQYVCLTLEFILPPEYPSVLPEIHIKNPRGLGDEHVIELRKKLLRESQEKKGECMLFELIEMTKESLTQSNVPHGMCAICQERFYETDSYQKTECYHYFHMNPCLLRYVQQEIEAIKQETNENIKIRHMEKEERQVVCPVCRKPITYDLDALSKGQKPEVEEIVYRPTAEMIEQQTKMAERYAKQKKKGGIIDLEENKKKYLLPQSASTNNIVGTTVTEKRSINSIIGSEQEYKEGVIHQDCQDYDRYASDKNTAKGRGMGDRRHSSYTISSDNYSSNRRPSKKSEWGSNNRSSGNYNNYHRRTSAAVSDIRNKRQEASYEEEERRHYNRGMIAKGVVDNKHRDVIIEGNIKKQWSTTTKAYTGDEDGNFNDNDNNRDAEIQPGLSVGNDKLNSGIPDDIKDIANNDDNNLMAGFQFTIGDGEREEDGDDDLIASTSAAAAVYLSADNEEYKSKSHSNSSINKCDEDKKAALLSDTSHSSHYGRNKGQPEYDYTYKDGKMNRNDSGGCSGRNKTQNNHYHTMGNWHDLKEGEITIAAADGDAKSDSSCFVGNNEKIDINNKDNSTSSMDGISMKRLTLENIENMGDQFTVPPSGQNLKCCDNTHGIGNVIIEKEELLSSSLGNNTSETGEEFLCGNLDRKHHGQGSNWLDDKYTGDLNCGSKTKKGEITRERTEKPSSYTKDGSDRNYSDNSRGRNNSNRSYTSAKRYNYDDNYHRQGYDKNKWNNNNKQHRKTDTSGAAKYGDSYHRQSFDNNPKEFYNDYHKNNNRNRKRGEESEYGGKINRDSADASCSIRHNDLPSDGINVTPSSRNDRYPSATDNAASAAAATHSASIEKSRFNNKGKVDLSFSTRRDGGNSYSKQGIVKQGDNKANNSDDYVFHCKDDDNYYRGKEKGGGVGRTAADCRDGNENRRGNAMRFNDREQGRSHKQKQEGETREGSGLESSRNYDRRNNSPRGDNHGNEFVKSTRGSLQKGKGYSDSSETVTKDSHHHPHHKDMELGSKRVVKGNHGDQEKKSKHGNDRGERKGAGVIVDDREGIVNNRRNDGYQRDKHAGKVTSKSIDNNFDSALNRRGDNSAKSDRFHVCDTDTDSRHGNKQHYISSSSSSKSEQGYNKTPDVGSGHKHVQSKSGDQGHRTDKKSHSDHKSSKHTQRQDSGSGSEKSVGISSSSQKGVYGFSTGSRHHKHDGSSDNNKVITPTAKSASDCGVIIGGSKSIVSTPPGFECKSLPPGFKSLGNGKGSGNNEFIHSNNSSRDVRAKPPPGFS